MIEFLTVFSFVVSLLALITLIIRWKLLAGNKATYLFGVIGLVFITTSQMLSRFSSISFALMLGLLIIGGLLSVASLLSKWVLK